MVIDALEHRSLVTQLADSLRSAIVKGQFELGEELPEVRVAQEFNVSRTTVREALRILSAEGFLEKKPRGTWRIRQLSESTIWEAVTVRANLEGLAAYLACQLMTSESEEILRQIIGDMEASAKRDDYEAFSEADLRFHRTLVRLADNDVLETVWWMTYVYSVLMVSSRAGTIPSLHKIQDDHRRSLEAIVSGDPREAELVVKTQIFESYRRGDYDKHPEPWSREEHSIQSSLSSQS